MLMVEKVRVAEVVVSAAFGEGVTADAEVVGGGDEEAWEGGQ